MKMQHVAPKPNRSFALRALYTTLVPIPAACFIAAFVTDLLYIATYAGMWETFSIWLITAGLIVATAAILLGIAGFFAGTRRKPSRPTFFYLAGCALIVIVSFVNAFVHSRDGYSAVVPTGVALSAIVTFLIVLTTWQGKLMVSDEFGHLS
jgi:uncharacterized membrane protein